MICTENDRFENEAWHLRVIRKTQHHHCLLIVAELLRLLDCSCQLLYLGQMHITQALFVILVDALCEGQDLIALNLCVKVGEIFFAQCFTVLHLLSQSVEFDFGHFQYGLIFFRQIRD